MKPNHDQMNAPKQPSSPRAECEIFADLGTLSCAPGFPEALAQMCAEANTIRFDGGLTGESLSGLYDRGRLIRTEISALVGLLARSHVDESTPPAETVLSYVARAKALFEELHDALSLPWRESIHTAFDGRAADDALGRGAAMREPFFYSGESAFSFQYRDFAAQRYAGDDAWLRANRGFGIALARDVVNAIGRLQTRKLIEVLEARDRASDRLPAFLPAFVFTAEEVAKLLRVRVERVRPVLAAFSTAPEAGNPTFEAIQDFNVTNASPLLRLSDDRFLLFPIYSLCEALYESPTYWMLGDKAYWSGTAEKNRGDFTEQFARTCLAGVFGRAAVHANVEIPGARKARRGEIDVLVVFGDHAIVVQAKSKRLTLDARRGSDGHIRRDFQSAIQDACDQARDCAIAILEGDALRTADGKPLHLPPIRQVYPVCLVADHYPALAAQVRRFLSWAPADGVAPPMVSDLFTLDALTEMLSSPLRVINYLSLRARFVDRLLFNHELTLLGVHLKHSLWFDDEFDQVLLDDGLGADLDAAMAVRREALPGPRTPEGLLTRTAGTALTRLIDQIERNPDAVALGLTLLQFGEESHMALSRALEHMRSLWRQDGQAHDFAIPLPLGGGITFHINARSDGAAHERLEMHCRLKKHQQRADVWYGVLLEPRRGDVRAALRLDEPWEHDPDLDAAAAHLQSAPVPRRDLLKLKVSKSKPNSPCPCGSGQKYKRCCRP